MRFTEPYTIFPRKLPSGRVVYYYQFRDEYGVRSAARSTGTSIKAQAKRICQRLYNEGLFQKNSTQLFKTFAKGFFDEGSPYMQWKRASGYDLSKSTVASYKMLLETKILPYFGEKQISRISTGDVKNWIVWLNERWSAKTSNNAQSVLNIILKEAKEKRLIREVPSADLSFRKIKKKERVLLTVEELAKIYASPEWRWECARRAFLVCAVTGMRIGEVTGLQTADVEDDRLNVQHSLHPRFGLGETKTRVNRFVPIPPAMGLKETCGDVWAFEKPTENAPVDENYVYKRFTAIVDSLGIDRKARGITVHTLRNLFISYMRGSSFGEKIDLKIKAVVGHADESMTDWYTYWTPEMFPEIYEVQEKLWRQIVGGEK
ncbi:MAG: tyrosine-type recombinase/integrase family protein [Treponema sp.]|nr:tyrosine-type recombinase/integrase family protein [Treponema sp.]